MSLCAVAIFTNVVDHTAFIVFDPIDLDMEVCFARRDAEMFSPNEPRTRRLAARQNAACGARSDARIAERERESANREVDPL